MINEIYLTYGKSMNKPDERLGNLLIYYYNACIEESGTYDLQLKDLGTKSKKYLDEIINYIAPIILPFIVSHIKHWEKVCKIDTVPFTSEDIFHDYILGGTIDAFKLGGKKPINRELKQHGITHEIAYCFRHNKINISNNYDNICANPIKLSKIFIYFLKIQFKNLVFYKFRNLMSLPDVDWRGNDFEQSNGFVEYNNAFKNKSHSIDQSIELLNKIKTKLSSNVDVVMVDSLIWAIENYNPTDSSNFDNLENTIINSKEWQSIKFIRNDFLPKNEVKRAAYFKSFETLINQKENLKKYGEKFVGVNPHSFTIRFNNLTKYIQHIMNNKNLNENKNMNKLDEFINKIVRQVINEVYRPGDDYDRDYEGYGDEENYRDYELEDPENLEKGITVDNNNNEKFINAENPDLNTADDDTEDNIEIPQKRGRQTKASQQPQPGVTDDNDNGTEDELLTITDDEANELLSDDDLSDIEITSNEQAHPIELWVNDLAQGINPIRSRYFNEAFTILYTNKGLLNVVEKSFRQTSAKVVNRYNDRPYHYGKVARPRPIPNGKGAEIAEDVLMDYITGKDNEGYWGDSLCDKQPKNPTEKNPDRLSNIGLIIKSFRDFEKNGKKGVDGVMGQLYRQLGIYSLHFSSSPKNYFQLSGTPSSNEIDNFEKNGKAEDNIQFDKVSDLADRSGNDNLSLFKGNYVDRGIGLLRKVQPYFKKLEDRILIQSIIWAASIRSDKNFNPGMFDRVEEKVMSTPEWAEIQKLNARSSEDARRNLLPEKNDSDTIRAAYFKYAEKAIAYNRKNANTGGRQLAINYWAVYVRMGQIGSRMKEALAKAKEARRNKNRNVSEQRVLNNIQRLINEVVRRTLKQYIR